MIYTTGTIAINGNTVTGMGTNFNAPLSLIRVGCTLIAIGNPVQIFTITEIKSGTELSVTPAANPAIPAGTKFSILLSDSISVDGLAQDVAETLRYYQTLRFPELSNDGAVLISNGGTGATTAEKARENLGIGLAATFDTVPLSNGGTGGTTTFTACSNLHALNYKHPFSTRYDSPELDTGIGFYDTDRSTYPGGGGAPYPYAEIMTIAENGGGSGSSGNWSQIGFSTITEQAPRYRQRFSSPARITEWRDFWVRDINTTVDSNGFIKLSSPIVKIKGDGNAEFNAESEGCSVTRVSKGVYVISGCLGLNSDASWGGVNGGFEVPLDVNKQPLVWLDYAVLNDGSIEVRTYHRTHTNAPAFARNEIEGVAEGDPVDIPYGTFISVRVNMPE